MRKGIMALEELNKAGILEEELDNEINAIDVADKFISQETDLVEEARSISTAVGTMTKVVQASVDNKEELNDLSITTLNAAMEHFCTRLQYQKRVIPALESFQTASRSAQTQFAFENLKRLNDSLKKKLVVAQEGLFNKLTNAIEKKFTSTEKILKQIEAFKGKEARDPVSLKDQAWASVFNPKGHAELNATDVIAYLKAISATPRQEIYDSFSQTEKYMKNAKKVMADYLDVEQETTTSKLGKMRDSIDAMILGFQKKQISINGAPQPKADIVTANRAQIDQLSALVVKTLDQTEFQKRYSEFEKNAYVVYSEITNSEAYAQGDIESDYAEGFIQTCFTLLDCITKYVDALVTLENEAAYSAYKYLSASIQK